MSSIRPSSPPRRGPRKRSDRVAERVKQWIMEEKIASGGRLPQEKELIRLFAVSKGTIREALKSLEVQGLITMRTGPNGGATVSDVNSGKATELLSNYFYSKNLSLRDIYAVRKLIEPELAEAVVGHLGEADFEALEHNVGFCSCAPLGADANRMQRIAELDFHDVLADACPNPVLAFYCRFVNGLLKNLAVVQKIYVTPQPELADRGREYHLSLIEAFRAEDREAVRRVMHAHMIEAERIMVEHETVIERRFLLEEDLGASATK